MLALKKEPLYILFSLQYQETGDAGILYTLNTLSECTALMWQLLGMLEAS